VIVDQKVHGFSIVVLASTNRKLFKFRIMLEKLFELL